jgi:hypothetical protein
MERKENGAVKKTAAVKKQTAPNCETCTFYDYDEDYDEYYCRANLDQDDLARLGASSRAVCPYYRLYDEYKSVRKQN